MARPPGLIVFVPGLPGAKPSAELIDRLKAEAPQDWSVEFFDSGITPTSKVDVNQIVRDLAAQVDEWSGGLDGTADEVKSIVLIGHSFGGVAVRAAWLEAGVDASGRIRPGSWAAKVTRFVLIGSPNGGFRLTSMPFWLQTVWRLLTPWRDYTIENLVEGAPWIADLRLRWVDAFRNPANEKVPEIVQVLGTKDDLVGRKDVEDSKYLTATRTYVTPRANHGGLVRLDDPKTAEERWKRIRPAVFEAADGDIADADAQAQEAMDTEPFTFLIHGIRASGNDSWVRRLETALGKEHTRVINYGFFSPIQFANGLTRRKQTYRFINAYSREYAGRDPNQFAIVGHSNGTYILGSALQAVHSMRFRRIMLAGSVLPPDFDWDALENQVGSWNGAGWIQGTVYNERAAVDYPVGFLCSMLNGLGNKDIGAAGFSGFVDSPPFVREFDTVFPKGHGSALAEHEGYPERSAQIATLMTAGEPDVAPKDETRKGFAWLSRIVNRWPVGALLIAVLAALIFFIGWWVAAATTLWIGLVVGLVIVLLIGLFVRTF